jgi:hypothetical protein
MVAMNANGLGGGTLSEDLLQAEKMISKEAYSRYM